MAPRGQEGTGELCVFLCGLLGPLTGRDEGDTGGRKPKIVGMERQAHPAPCDRCLHGEYQGTCAVQETRLHHKRKPHDGLYLFETLLSILLGVIPRNGIVSKVVLSKGETDHILSSRKQSGRSVDRR